MSHTPGPWDYDSFALREEIMSENNPLIATVCSVHCKKPEEMRANARLIAAAPELLEALVELADQYQYNNGFDEIYEAAMKVIAKARGSGGFGHTGG